MAEPVSAAIGIGANLGDRRQTIAEAVRAIGRISGVELDEVAEPVETEAVLLNEDAVPQPDFMNTVCVVQTTLTPRRLLGQLQEIETSFGRPSVAERERWAPRVLDLDLLLYSGNTVDMRDLQVPHPRMTERWFVLKPLADIAPGWVVPGTGRTVTSWLSEVEQHA
ncbi:MAG: 2-amino-4-hydroxy-6-hydroxymethyldihydropteridine diphosphokinase [Planctomycetota bacterium]